MKFAPSLALERSSMFLVGQRLTEVKKQVRGNQATRSTTQQNFFDPANFPPDTTFRMSLTWCNRVACLRTLV